MSGRRWAGVLLMSVILVGAATLAASQWVSGEVPGRPVVAMVLAAIGLVSFWRVGRES